MQKIYDTANRFAVTILAASLFITLGMPCEAVRAEEPTVFLRHPVLFPGQPQMTAFTLLAPEGWKVEGAMERTPPQLRNMFTLTDLEVEAPDGRSIHFYPAMSFNYSDYTQAQPMQPVNGAFFLRPPQSIGQWILDMARMNPDPDISDIRLISEDAMPEWTQSLRQMFAGQIQEIRSMQHAPGGQSFMDVWGMKVIFTYNDNGKPMEETFLVGWRLMSMSTYGQIAMCNWGIIDMRSLAGPAGSDYTNDPSLVTINQSLRFNPQYYEAMHRYYQETFRRVPPKTPAQLKEDGKSVGDILQDGWKQRNAIQDAGQRREIDMIHERTPYATPGGETVYLSSHYQRVFSDGQDRYLLTNDANWNPAVDPVFKERNWQVLQPRRE